MKIALIALTLWPVLMIIMMIAYAPLEARRYRWETRVAVEAAERIAREAGVSRVL